MGMGYKLFLAANLQPRRQLPDVAEFFSVLDLGSRTHRLMLVRRRAKTRGSVFIKLGLLPRLCWAMPFDVFLATFGRASPRFVALLGPWRMRGPAFVLVGALEVGRRWPHFGCLQPLPQS